MYFYTLKVRRMSFLTRNKLKILVAGLLIVLGVVLRLVPHIWNFAPIVGIALISGRYLGGRYAVAVPVLAMILGDIFVGFYSLPVIISVYGSFALVGIIGLALRGNWNPISAGGASVLSSFIFFITTNFAVWAFTPMYLKTLSGLMTSYTMAIPFFRAGVVGDLFYTMVLYGVFELAIYLYNSKFSLLNPSPQA